MNHKILYKLEQLIHTSPQLLRQPKTLRQAIQGTFDVEIDDVDYNTIGELVDRIDDKVLDNYFRNHWQGEMKKYKYSGLKLIDEVNSLSPRRVLDIGCGYHEFKGKIDNLTGIDPYNTNADHEVKLLDYNPKEKFDATLALGSINFGSTDKIFAELEHAVSLCNPGAVMFFRANPGLPHENEPDRPRGDQSKWISFYAWDSNFVVNCASQLGVDILDIRTDTHKNRMYFVWRTK
tara:strand:+ start:2027 stop:2728 length:702 start_codon:yes stop_codon:yes gene_type:complete